MSCPETIPQIQRDLAQFPSVDPEKIATEIPKRFGQRQSLCHYTLKDNKVLFTPEAGLFVLGGGGGFFFRPFGYNQLPSFIKNPSGITVVKFYLSEVCWPVLLDFQNKHSLLF